MAAQTLFDALSGAFGHSVDRAGLNAYVANSQATNGLRTAQTEEALTNAQQKQEELQAHADLENSLAGTLGDDGKPILNPSQAHLVANELKGHFGSALEVMNAMKSQIQTGATAKLANPANLGTDVDTAAQAAIKGAVPGPIQVPNNYQNPPGVNNGPVLQSPQGAALTAKDIADAEEAHAKAKNASNPVGGLDPQTIHDGALVVMADPTKMSQYAGFGQSGQNNKNSINNEIARQLNAAGMTAGDMIRARAVAKASIGGAGQAAKQAETLDAFTPLVRSNGDRILQLLQQVDDDGANLPVVAGIQRAAGRQLGSADLAELHSVFGTYQQEIARLLASSPTMAGVISDKARGETQNMAPENMTTAQARRVINRINTEIGIRRQGVQNAMDSATGAQLPVTETAKPNAAPASPGAAPAAPMSLDAYLKSKGF